MTRTGEVTPDGKKVLQYDYRIIEIDGDATGNTSAARKRVIEDALYAYGMLHDGPLGPVFVTFDE